MTNNQYRIFRPYKIILLENAMAIRREVLRLSQMTETDGAWTRIKISSVGLNAFTDPKSMSFSAHSDPETGPVF
jgi:hypothetical protein